MKDNSEFWKNMAWAFFMFFCMILNIHTMSIGVEKGHNSSIIIGGIAFGMCFICFVADIIRAIDSYKN